MEHFASLDVSMKATSICVCDAEGAARMKRRNGDGNALNRRY